MVGQEFLATADRGQLSLADERAEIVRALPWALVFGLTEEWTKRLEVLDIDPQREMGGRYSSPTPLHPAVFTRELTSMGTGIAGDLSYSPSSSSAGGGSGFSGGGSVGGGGGGSW